MWMMGCKDGAELNLPADSFNGRKLRPLIPRSNHPPPCLGRFSGADLFSLNHHFSAMGDQSKGTDFNAQQPVVVSSRWNPTPEQLRTLEELYVRGTHTPSTDQIQHITAQLRRYGKIEGKNVFYWFQNHKARERQKRRRQMESVAGEHHRDVEILEWKDSGAHRTAEEVEQNKNWGISTPAEEMVPIQTAAKGTVAGGRADHGWIHFEGEELQQRRSFLERNGTWQTMQLSSSTETTRGIMDHREFITNSHHEGFNIFLSAPYKNGNGFSVNHFKDLRDVQEGEGEDGCRASQALELFPLCGIGDGRGDEKAAEIASVPGMNGNSFATSYQFFEFLPSKN